MSPICDSIGILDLVKTAFTIIVCRALANCTTSIPAACSVPNITANFTQLETCQTYYKAIQKKNAECLEMRTDGAKACQCWAAAANLTKTAKLRTEECDAQTAQKNIKKIKVVCLAAFGGCKKAEDSSVGYIMSCSGSSSNSSSTNSSSTNSTGRRSSREAMNLLSLADFISL